LFASLQKAHDKAILAEAVIHDFKGFIYSAIIRIPLSPPHSKKPLNKAVFCISKQSLHDFYTINKKYERLTL